jgi:hypothetical protein
VDVPQKKARVAAFLAAPARNARARARVALRGRALDVTALELHAGATRLKGAAQVDARHLEATLAARVAPREAAAIGIHPTAPIRLRVTLHGPLRAVAVRVESRLRAARVALVGHIDLHARRGQLYLVAHDVRPSEIVPNAPPLTFSGAFSFEGAIRAQTGVAGNMSVTNGKLSVAGQRFDRLYGTGRVQIGRRGEVNVAALTGRLEGSRPRQLVVQTRLRWNPQALRVDASRVLVDQSRAAGTVIYTHDPLTRQPLVVVRAQKLSLSPSLVQEALHRRSAKAWPGNAKLVWTPEDMRLTFALGTDLGPASGTATLRRERGTPALSNVDVALGGSRLRGTARVKNGELVDRCDELLLQPQLAHALLPAVAPTRAMRVQGAVAGPLYALDLHLLATAGASTARVRGRVDWRARSFELLATLDSFYFPSIKQTQSSRVNAEMSLVGRLVAGGMAGMLKVRHASGVVQGLPLDAARIRVALNGPNFSIEKFLIGVPGAVVEAQGGGTFSDFHIGYGVVVTNALALKKVPKELRLLIGLTALTPGRSVVGTVRRHAGGKIEFTHHTIPPPFRWVNMIYHVLTGHPLHLTVH